VSPRHRPDLCAIVAAGRLAARLVFLGDRDVIAARAKQRGLPFDLPDYFRARAHPPRCCTWPRPRR